MSKEIQSHKDLVVWQKSMQLVIMVYEITEKYPQSEIYGLTSQTRRAAVSIPSNIAEGRRLSSKKDYAHFLSISLGSAAELETQIEIAESLPFGQNLDFIEVKNLLEEILRILTTMIRNLKHSPQS